MKIEYWKPFERADTGTIDPKMLAIAHEAGYRPENGEIWINNIYQVMVNRLDELPIPFPKLIHLSIKRRDKTALHDWRHLQRIKNEIIGPENEGVELFPAESRLVDAANQYHLFVLATPGTQFPFGFGDRWVSNTSELGSVQRPFPENATPPDCMTLDQYIAALKKKEAAGVQS